MKDRGCTISTYDRLSALTNEAVESEVIAKVKDIHQICYEHGMFVDNP